ncbi:iron-sulfur cluster biosynthesis transcriptional regulator SufR [Pseudanabaena sp. FACHB-2040]|uniref:iron-sulfur cluster biosynthesis transcriptional regulator SufR n=1 Tax=Pseudanabaena sp. FACHB-2040 TaxID=2692859 RepID=UPI0016878807|nr:iron-sulfur cluster biosynthesis transcriptional regulator SufR [Pseudanabaena sp. FACHB-2040]MBD2257441.1 iron-sulfur cluster biosynthesis transcriptional regulator SufR [Pseudanabaena sp. FACHB-2040]
MTSLHHPSTKEDILKYLLKHGESTAQALADHLEVSAQAIRRHLKDLEAEALIEHRAVQEGMGRPNHFYRLSRKGRDHFPAQYDEFALSLLNTLTETVGKDQVGTILRKQWERKAVEYRQQVGEGAIADRVATLVHLRQEEGYMTEWHRVEPENGAETRAKFVITEYNCAISHIAETFPTVCGHELEMFQVALPDCLVTRTHWLVHGEHRCGYLIQAKQ